MTISNFFAHVSFQVHVVGDGGVLDVSGSSWNHSRSSNFKLVVATNQYGLKGLLGASRLLQM